MGGKRTSPTTSFTAYMASDDALDTDITVTWTYQDANGVEDTVSVSTNASDGRTPVSLGVTATEVYRGKLDGSKDSVGNISCLVENDFTNGVPDDQVDVLAYINLTDNQTQVLAFRVPAEKYALIESVNILVARESGAASSVIGSIDIRETGKVWRSIRPFSITTSSPLDLSDEIVLLNPLTDVRVRIRDVSDNDTDITGVVIYSLIDQ